MKTLAVWHLWRWSRFWSNTTDGRESNRLLPRWSECSWGGMIVVFRIFGGSNPGRIGRSQGKSPHQGRLSRDRTWNVVAMKQLWSHHSAQFPPPKDEKNLPSLNFPQLLCHLLCVLQGWPVIKLTFRAAGWSGKPEISFWLLRFRVEVEWQVTNTIFTWETVTSASFSPVVPPPFEVFQLTFYKHGRALKHLNRHFCSERSAREAHLWHK